MTDGPLTDVVRVDGADVPMTDTPISPDGGRSSTIRQIQDLADPAHPAPGGNVTVNQTGMVALTGRVLIGSRNGDSMNRCRFAFWVGSGMTGDFTGIQVQELINLGDAGDCFGVPPDKHPENLAVGDSITSWQGIGRALLEALIDESEKNGIWTRFLRQTVTPRPLACWSEHALTKPRIPGPVRTAFPTDSKAKMIEFHRPAFSFEIDMACFYLTRRRVAGYLPWPRPRARGFTNRDGAEIAASNPLVGASPNPNRKAFTLIELLVWIFRQIGFWRPSCSQHFPPPKRTRTPRLARTTSGKSAWGYKCISSIQVVTRQSGEKVQTAIRQWLIERVRMPSINGRTIPGSVLLTSRSKD